MVAVDYETPLKMALSVAKEATPDSSGKDILQRYRELVAQKSAERQKDQSPKSGNQSINSPSSSVYSDGSSLGSMSSIDEDGDQFDDENSDDMNDYEKDEFYGKENNQPRSSRKVKGCKDNLTNEMVHEATMITNIVKETIREKQLNKQQQQKHLRLSGNASSSKVTTTPLKTPAKNKTPSKFKVFEDLTKFTPGNNSTLKSNRKISALKPKSTNTPQRQMTDKKQTKGLVMSSTKGSSNGSTMKMNQNVKQQTITATDTKVMSPKVLLSSPAPRPSTSKKRGQQSSVEKRQDSRQLYEQNNKKSEETIVVNLKRQSPPKPENQSTEKEIEKVPNQENDSTAATQDVTEVIVEEEDEAVLEGDIGTPLRKYVANHNPLEKEEGELLSMGSPNISSSVLSATVKNVDTLDDEINEKSVTNGEGDEEEDDHNTCSSSLDTPTSSVQTFSIGGRSYSFDVSANALKNMFTATPSKARAITDESITGDSIYQDISVRTENILNDSVSPTSKILANSKLDGGISRSSAASLIERNKTLIKEVRFADQTCVELSEKNASILRDNTRMEGQIGEMKKYNESLHQEIVMSKQDCAKLEENKLSLTKQLDEQKGYYEAQMRVLQQALKEAKTQNEIITIEVNKSNASKQSTERDLISTQAKFEALQESHNEAKEKITSLMARLATSQSTAEVSAASAAQSYREFCDQMQQKVEKLERVAEERLYMYNKEKDERVQVEFEHSNSIRKCAELEKLIENWEMNNNLVSNNATPNKSVSGIDAEVSKDVKKTPTSSVLARTLEAELQRGHDATERILEAEMIISVTQSELQESSRQLLEAKMEIERLNNRVQELTEERIQHVSSVSEDSEPSVQIEDIHVKNASCDNSSLETLSTDELVGKVLSKQLTNARTECEDYKRELEKILNEIKRVQGESFNSSSTKSQDVSNEQTVAGLLQAVRELAQVCAKQADEINSLKSKCDDRKIQIEKIDGLLEERNGRIEDQNRIIENFKLKMESMTKDLSCKAEELEKKNAQMDMANKQSMSRLNQKEIEIANHQMKCTDFENEVNELSRLCKHQADEITLMQNDMKKVKKELKVKDDELVSHNYRQESLLNEVDELVHRITNIKDQYSKRS